MQHTFIKKYGIQSFKEIKQNDVLVKLYDKMIQNNKMALLIVGNKSAGKTTHINVIINEYFKKYNILDIENYILRINSLNEYGIQYSRNRLKTFCQTKSFIKKIIVIDDLDLINEQNQQIIRGNLNNYIDNVHFLCSCSNTKKINETLQSRLQCLNINNISKDDLIDLYTKIVKLENIQIDDNLKDLVLKQADYSCKTMLNILELFKLYGYGIQLQDCLELCNSIPYTYFDKYIEYCKIKNIDKATDYLNQLIYKGYSVIDIYNKFISYLNYDKHLKLDIKYEIVKIISKYICIFYTIHESSNELILFTKNIINIF